MFRDSPVFKPSNFLGIFLEMFRKLLGYVPVQPCEGDLR